MKEIFPLIILAAVFALSAFLTQQYIDTIRQLIIGYDFFGIIFYIFAVIIAIVVAPLSSIPLIPLAVNLWGIFWTVTASVLGWTIGSMVDFWIARKYGSRIVKRLISLEKIKESYKNIPEKNIFWYLIFLRMTTPVDILSYALGLFTNIKWKIYFITTLIGVIPATIALAYLGALSARYQSLIFIIGIAVIILFIIFNKRREK